MKLMQRVSFPGPKEFEQYSAEFTLEDSDIPSKFYNGCNLLEKMYVFNVLVSLEGILFMYAKGYFDEKEYKAQKERFLSTLSPKLKAVVKNIVGDKNGSDTE